MINHKKLSTHQQANHKNFESRKTSINRIQGLESTKNNMNRIGTKS